MTNASLQRKQSRAWNYGPSFCGVLSLSSLPLIVLASAVYVSGFTAETSSSNTSIENICPVGQVAIESVCMYIHFHV